MEAVRASQGGHIGRMWYERTRGQLQSEEGVLQVEGAGRANTGREDRNGQGGGGRLGFCEEFRHGHEDDVGGTQSYFHFIKDSNNDGNNSSVMDNVKRITDNCFECENGKGVKQIVLFS